MLLNVSKDSDDDSKEKFRFRQDYPITSAEEDKFKHSYFVDILEYILEHSKSPINIGFYGKWGVGKSSILNLFEKRLNENGDLKKKYRYLYVDAWKLSPQSLKQELLIELNKQLKVLDEEKITDELYNIKEEEFKVPPKLSGWNRLKEASSYIAIFFAILIGGYIADLYTHSGILTPSIIASVVVPVLLAMMERFNIASLVFMRSSKRIIPKAESSHQFKKIFDTMVDKTIRDKDNQSLVISIDNLDRCEDYVVVEMLGMIKTFMNVKGCIFIIACDDDAIVKHLTGVKGTKYSDRDAIEFLTKFFQITIKIPPFIEGELENYAQSLVKTLPIHVDPVVTDILLAGATKNPRKIQQFLNNLVVLTKLAEHKENENIITKGTITQNTSFLTRLIVLREEWPKFYREWEMQEDLLEFAERYLRGERSQEIQHALIENLLNDKDNRGLEYFLRATMGVYTSDMSAFLRLNQESFESTMPERETFIQKTSQNDIEYVRSRLENLDSEQKRIHIQEIINLLDNYIRRNRSLFASNCINVLLEIFDHVPEQLQNDALDRLGRYIPLSEIIPYTNKFDIIKLFTLLRQMRANLKEQILSLYTTLLTSNNVLKRSVLEQFIANKDLISTDVIDKLNYNLASLLSANEKDGLEALDRMMENDETKSMFVRPVLINALLQNISAQISPDNNKKVSMYLKIKNLSSLDNKILFVKRMLDIANLNKGNTMDGNLQLAINNFAILTENDLPFQAASQLYDGMNKFINQMVNEPDKIMVVKAILPSFNRLDEDRKNSFIDTQLAPMVAGFSPGSLVEIAESAKKTNAQILQYDKILDNLANRLYSTGPMDARIINFLAENAPNNKKEKVGDIFVRMIKTNNPSFYNIITSKFREYYQSFPKEVIGKVSQACIDIAKITPWNQASDLLNTSSVTLEKSPAEIKNQVSDIIISWVQSDDPAQRNQALSMLKSAIDNLTKQTQQNALRQVILKLQSLFDRNDTNVEPLVELLVSNFDKIEEDDKIRFIDTVLGQMSTAKPEQIQTLALQYVTRINLGKRAETVLDSILNLGSSSNQNIKNRCKEVLKQLNKYSGNEKFWKEAKKTFGDDVYQKS